MSKEEIKRDMRKYIEINENTMNQNFWDAVKAVLRGKFIAVKAYIKKEERSHIGNLILHLKEWEKEQTPDLAEKKEIIKIRTEINKMENEKKLGKNKTESCFLQKI